VETETALGHARIAFILDACGSAAMPHTQSVSAGSPPVASSSNDSVAHPSATYRFFEKLTTAFYSGSNSSLGPEETSQQHTGKLRTSSVSDYEDFDSSVLQPDFPVRKKGAQQRADASNAKKRQSSSSKHSQPLKQDATARTSQTLSQQRYGLQR
jgi:hypothetical protein